MPQISSSPRPSALVAAIGSVSYGVLPAERLMEILGQGSAPDAGERARLYQAISESEPNLLFGLAAEAGMTMDALEARVAALLGVSPRDINPWLNGELY